MKFFLSSDIELFKNWHTITENEVIRIKKIIITYLNETFNDVLNEQLIKCTLIPTQFYYDYGKILIYDEQQINLLYSFIVNNSTGDLELLYKTNDYDYMSYYSFDETSNFPILITDDYSIETRSNDGVYDNKGNKMKINNVYNGYNDDNPYIYEPLSLNEYNMDKIMLFPEYNRKDLFACVLLRHCVGTNICMAYIDKINNCIYKWNTINEDYPCGYSLRRIKITNNTQLIDAELLLENVNDETYLLYKSNNVKWCDLQLGHQFKWRKQYIYESFDNLYFYINYQKENNISESCSSYLCKLARRTSSLLKDYKYDECITVCKNIINMPISKMIYSSEKTNVYNYAKYNLACVYSLTNDILNVECAIDILIEIEPFITSELSKYILTDIDLDNLRQNDRFIKLIKRINQNMTIE